MSKAKKQFNDETAPTLGSAGTRIDAAEQAHWGQKLLTHFSSNLAPSEDMTFFYVNNCHADLEQRDEYGATPLIWATKRRQPTMIKLMLKHGAQIDAVDNNGDSAYRHALAIRHPATLQALEDEMTQRETNLREVEEQGAALQKPAPLMPKIKLKGRK